MVGGVAGLAGAWVAGPRLGRFNSQGKPQPIHGHNAVYYTIGAYPSQEGIRNNGILPADWPHYTGSSNYVSWTALRSFVLVPIGYLLLALGFFCFNSGMV